jgi:hypothetical protein
MTGIELRRKVAKMARGPRYRAAIIEADARHLPLEPAHAMLLFDVLRLLTVDEQDALLAQLAARLDRGGVLLVREADASGGWRFAAGSAIASSSWCRQLAPAVPSAHRCRVASVLRGQLDFRSTRADGRRVQPT